MQVRLRLSLLAAMAFAPMLAWAHNCPLEMRKIDEALQRSKTTDPATLKKIRDLREEGEKLHKQDKHGEAMLVLGSAKKLLRIE